MSARWRFSLTALLLGSAQLALGQTAIVRDGSVGPGITVQPLRDGNVIEIDESHGNRPGGGVNLLHSFSEFSIGAGDTALFSADPNLTTARIISRVTGSMTSELFGTLAVNVPGADLFLLNPQGIVLGPDASLDTQGSVYLSTASSLSLLDDDPMGAVTFTNDVRLAFADPISFGFLAAPATLTVDGATLTLSGNQSLSLSGHDVTLNAGSMLRADAGISVAATGGQTLPVDLEGWAPDESSGGQLRITESSLATETSGNRKAGDVLLVSGGMLTMQGGSATSATLGSGSAGDVVLRARVIELSDGTFLSSSSGPAVVGGGGAGSGSGSGSLVIKLRSEIPVAVLDGTDIASSPTSGTED